MLNLIHLTNKNKDKKKGPTQFDIVNGFIQRKSL